MVSATAKGQGKAQSTPAFEEEALPHMDDLFRAAVRLLLDQSKASDAVQQTYLVAWKSFDRYEPGTNCRTAFTSCDRQVVSALDGEGYTEVGGRRFDWEANDIVVMPNFLWRRHVNTGEKDAVLYTVSDAALMRNIGQYRAQGKTADGTVVQLVH